ncbi:unnamed protein product [Schistocephalus solidus]|uniref:MULE domain-containing protein n=1 Tax=Schistocephalus solidus TaxID=70667 RepID=A0A183TMZ0_SCHSO|nr:unnamed protein product [Schistocephalus solidus]
MRFEEGLPREAAQDQEKMRSCEFMRENGTKLLQQRVTELARELKATRDTALEKKFLKLLNPISSRNDILVHNLSSKELTKEPVDVLRHEASFNTADVKYINVITAVGSVIKQTEATEETKNLLRQQVSSLLMAHKPTNGESPRHGHGPILWPSQGTQGGRSSPTHRIVQRHSNLRTGEGNTNGFCKVLNPHGLDMTPPHAARQLSRSCVHGQTTFVLTGFPSAYDIPALPYTLLCPLRLLTCTVSRPRYTFCLQPALCVGYITLATRLNEQGFIIAYTVTFLAEKNAPKPSNYSWLQWRKTLEDYLELIPMLSLTCTLDVNSKLKLIRTHLGELAQRYLDAFKLQ